MQGAHHRLEVLALVVGGQADGGAQRAVSSLWMATTLPRNADVAEQLELLADLLEIEGEAASACSRTGGRRRGFARRAARSPAGGRRARRRSCRGSARRSRRRSSRSSRTARSKRSRSAARRSRRGRRLPAPPRPRSEERAEDLAGARGHDARRAEGGGAGPAAADAAGHGREGRGEHPQVASARKKQATGPPRTLLGRALPALLAVVEVLARAPGRRPVSRPAARAAARRRCATSTSSRPRATRRR